MEVFPETASPLTMLSWNSAGDDPSGSSWDLWWEWGRGPKGLTFIKWGTCVSTRLFGPDERSSDSGGRLYPLTHAFLPVSTTTTSFPLVPLNPLPPRPVNTHTDPSRGYVPTDRAGGWSRRRLDPQTTPCDETQTKK